MLWLALHFPDLPLEAFERSDPASPANPASCAGPTSPSPDVTNVASAALAVCDRLNILFANARARSAGVAPGMRRASAQALLPALRLVERNLARERTALGSLASWALQFTPSVCLPEPPPNGAGGAGRSTMPSPAGLLLEIEPSLRLFGGLRALLTRIRADLDLLGYRAASALAPTATGAWLLARHHDGIRVRTHESLHRQLDALPVALLAAAAPHLASLESIGVHHLADLDALPRAGLGRRFGPALLEEIDRARGLRPEVHAWLQVPAEFSGRLELLARVTAIEPLLFAARRLLGELAGWLAARQAAVRGFMLNLRHDDGSDTPIEIRLADPGRDVDRLFGVLRERLAGFRLHTPVDILELECTEVLPLPGDSASLLPSAASAQQSLGHLLERLQARLGRERVQRLHLVADHRPEAAWRATTFEQLPAAGPRAQDASPSAGMVEPGVLPRPLWLLRRPLRLRECNNQPWWDTPLALLAGPERIEAGWWDQSLVQRDYFIVEDTRHILYWVYRERTASSGDSPGWFMQGRFG